MTSKRKPSPSRHIPATGDVIMFLDNPYGLRLRPKERRFIYKLLERKNNRLYISRRTVITIDNSELGFKLMQQLFRKFDSPRDTFHQNYLLGRLINREELPEPERTPSRWRISATQRKELKAKKFHFRIQ